MIPIIGEKAETLNAMITSLNAEDKPARDYITSFPKEMWNEVKAACIRSGTTMTEMSRQYNGRAYTEAGRHIHSHTFKVNGGISRATLVRINAILNDEVLAAWIDSDVCFIEIDSIEDAGVQQCYDLTVPTTHSFIANDIVAHNTSLALNVTYELSLRGIPSLFYCMEMSSDRLAWKMACLANRREDIFVRADDVFYTSYLLRGKPFYLPELILTHDHNVIFETIRQAYRRYGLKLAVFDNLHFLCRDESHQREKLGVVSRGFKLLAEELQIPIILIVHPRKLKNSKQVMTSDDLKDSSSIHADADMVIVMHRDRLSTEDNPDDDDSTSEDDDNSIFSPETSIIVDAARYAPGGRAKLYFDGGQSRFLNMEDPDVPARN
jgi:replicative DNA helicase